MSKKVKKFNEHKYQLKLSELHEKAKAYREMIERIKILVPDADNIQQLEDGLNKKTGFSNPRMSAMAFGNEIEFDVIQNLSKQCEGITSDMLNKDYKLNQNTLKAIREEHTKYFTKEELNARKTLEDIIKDFNALPINYRRLIGFGRPNELMFHPLANRL